MIRILKIWFLILSLFTITNAYATDLTKESVENFIAKIDHAINTKDAQLFANFLSNDIEIILNIKSQGQEQVLKPTKQEYIESLKQGWALYTKYEYSRLNTVININNNKAFVSSIVNETVEFLGQSVVGESKSEVVIEIVNGTPLITKAISYSSI